MRKPNYARSSRADIRAKSSIDDVQIIEIQAIIEDIYGLSEDDRRTLYQIKGERGAEETIARVVN